jgi:hypothetical protein
MATWKRLKRHTSGTLIDVNMDHVVDIEREHGGKYTMLTFDFTTAEKLYKINVKETPDEIHTLSPLPSR